MKPIHGKNLGKDICKIFGLDPARVCGVDIKIHVGDVARLVVESYADAGEVDELLTELSSYTLVPRNE